jgi:hypothetical protein
MPTKAERIKVEVTDSTEGETRRFNITMTAPTDDFQLSDLLQQRGVISALNGELKQAVRVATEAYLSSAEGLIATLKQGTTTALDARSNGKRKARNGTRKAPTVAGTSELNKGVAALLSNES